MANLSLAKRTRRRVNRLVSSCRHTLVESSPGWAKTAFGPAASYFDMLFVDHGIFRLFYLNRHRLGEQAWRSAQPAPHQIRAMARDGIRTIVNLRGEHPCGSYWLEEEACRRYGIALVNFRVRSRAAPSRSELRGARELFERIEYPMLMHCKSGADRAGLMSVLYRHFREGVPLEIAKKELSLRFGHIRQADTGVLDYFFDRYLQDTAERPMPFLEWVDKVYDPKELKRTFMAKGWANKLVNDILRRE
ncbi:MAG TPA: sulfur transferase domain-containing protein [Hyphomicrobiaceae bacterium]|jgi:protein tyrosine/serine phosphatase